MAKAPFKAKKPTKEVEEENNGSRHVDVKIVGYTIPDLTKDQASAEACIVPMPIFSAEKNMYKKELTFSTIALAKEAIKARYGKTVSQ